MNRNEINNFKVIVLKVPPGFLRKKWISALKLHKPRRGLQNLELTVPAQFIRCTYRNYNIQNFFNNNRNTVELFIKFMNIKCWSQFRSHGRFKKKKTDFTNSLI